jgi:clan AA aspartic protease
MSFVWGNFTFRNPCRRELAPVAIRALVDTGANTLRIPPMLAAELELEEVERRELPWADGGIRGLPYVGPVQVSFGRHHSFAGAFILGDEVRVGAIALRDLDLVVVPALETVTVHPASPHIARGFAYGFREPARDRT